jgi:hypothetical protein
MAQFNKSTKDLYKEFNSCKYKEAHFDTWLHKHLINKLLLDVTFDIQHRALTHDDSKMTNNVEMEGFGKVGPLLSSVPFGTPEFETYKSEMQPAISHHMCNNRHHVESHENGVDDMNLIDLIEMLADWKAAGSRRDDSSIEKSIEMMSRRYKFSDDLKKIMKNTANYLKY